MRYRLIVVLTQDRNGEHTAFKPFVHHFFFASLPTVSQKTALPLFINMELS